MNIHEKYISDCIELAKNGKGNVSPNPLVGCVIVNKGKVIGRGYHEQFGGNHAEVNALIDAAEKKAIITGSTLYVNLEPCAHYGKTPPCTDIIIRTKVAEVIAGTKDPNPLVSGKGLDKLRKYGVKVKSGFLEDKCSELNKFFFKYVKSKIPYITLKAAQSIDGKIADIGHKSKWISSAASRKFVHQLRSEYDAVLVGKNTVTYDNPSLSVRMVNGRNPYRIVLDSELTSNLGRKVFSDRHKKNTILITTEKASIKKLKELDKRKVKILMCRHKKNMVDLEDAIEKIGMLGIASVLVEGGSEIFSSFLANELADEILLFTAPKFIGSGIPTFNNIKNLKMNISSLDVDKSGDDALIKIKFN